jgi:hypothetical protein
MLERSNGQPPAIYKKKGLSMGWGCKPFRIVPNRALDGDVDGYIEFAQLELSQPRVIASTTRKPDALH